MLVNITKQTDDISLRFTSQNESVKNMNKSALPIPNTIL